MPTLENQVIIITGSTRGFGYAIAQACLAAGAMVVSLAGARRPLTAH